MGGKEERDELVIIIIIVIIIGIVRGQPEVCTSCDLSEIVPEKPEVAV
mgnify:CR=1 FL=1